MMMSRTPLLVLLLLSVGVAISQDSHSGPNYAGIPGVPGFPGRNGSPGRDGRDGFKGEKGERGLSGETCHKGVAGEKGESGGVGRVGSKGNSGKLGPQGPAGVKGIKGERGEKGSKGEIFQLNWKQCVWTNIDRRDTGKIQECRFKKYYSSSALHVVYSGANKVHCSGSQECCSRWYFTFNGTECSTPATIDLIVYKYKTNDNLHRTRQMMGYCENIPSGNVVIALHVGICSTWKSTVHDAHTGWNSRPSRILVTEVSASQQQ